MMWSVSVTCFHSWSILPKYSSCISVERVSEDCGTLEKSLNFLASIDSAVKNETPPNSQSCCIK